MLNVKVKLPNLVWLAVSFPGFSIALCVFLSLWLHFKSATDTHCKVSYCFFCFISSVAIYSLGLSSLSFLSYEDQLKKLKIKLHN